MEMRPSAPHERIFRFRWQTVTTAGILSAAPVTECYGTEPGNLHHWLAIGAAEFSTAVANEFVSLTTNRANRARKKDPSFIKRHS